MLTYQTLIDRLRRGAPINALEARQAAEGVPVWRLLDDVADPFLTPGQPVNGEECRVEGCGGIIRIHASPKGSDGFVRQYLRCSRCGEKYGFLLKFDPAKDVSISENDDDTDGAEDGKLQE